MKTSVDDLAIFGGPPLFDAPLHVGRPNIGDRETFLARVNDILDRRILTNRGPYEQAFEQRIAEIAGVAHCVAMCNATVGLEILIRAAGLTGEVIVPAFTFVATAHALQWQEITPVFCDARPSDGTIDPEAIEQLIGPKTTGIIGVHVWGRACDTAALEAIAARHGLTLLFDAAHAFGCTHQGRPVGGFGRAEVFSFHATKFINSFEGGAIVTNDGALADKARLMRNFGFVDFDEVGYIGTNGKMSEISAAMGLTSIESLEAIVATNRTNYLAYLENLKGVPGVSLMRYDESERCNYQYIALLIDDRVAGVTRDAIHIALRAENVLARRYFYPGCHRMEPYRSSGAGVRALPETDRLAASALCLPTGTAVAVPEVERICHLVRFLVEHGDAVAARVRTA